MGIGELARKMYDTVTLPFRVITPPLSKMPDPIDEHAIAMKINSCMMAKREPVVAVARSRGHYGIVTEREIDELRENVLNYDFSLSGDEFVHSQVSSELLGSKIKGYVSSIFSNFYKR